MPILVRIYVFRTSCRTRIHTRKTTNEDCQATNPKVKNTGRNSANNHVKVTTYIPPHTWIPNSHMELGLCTYWDSFERPQHTCISNTQWPWTTSVKNIYTCQISQTSKQNPLYISPNIPPNPTPTYNWSCCPYQDVWERLQACLYKNTIKNKQTDRIRHKKHE